MKVLAFDPGYGRCGWGVIDELRGVYTTSYGCIETSAADSHEQRLADVCREANHLLKKHKPQLVALEQVFFSKNVKTAIAVAEVRGALLLLATQRGIPVVSPTPPEIKLAVTGYGRADKQQMQTMIQTLLKLKKPIPSDDAADALAAAYTALQTHKTRKKMAVQKLEISNRKLKNENG